MATEHFLISKDHFNNLIQKANELDKKNIELEKSTVKVLPKEIYHNKIKDDNEGENSTQDEYSTISSISSSGDDSYNTSESKSGVGITLKQNGVHVMSDNGDYEYITYDEYGIMEIKEMFDDPSDWTYIEPILEKLERYEDILNWDKDTGEILFQNKLILGSNIVELLKDSLSRGLHPKGKTEFYLGPFMINLKAKYIKDGRNKYLLKINSRNRYYNYDHNEHNVFGYKQIKKRKWAD